MQQNRLHVAENWAMSIIFFKYKFCPCVVSVHSADITLQNITIPNKISLHSALVQFLFKAAFLDFHQWKWTPNRLQWLFAYKYSVVTAYDFSFEYSTWIDDIIFSTFILTYDSFGMKFNSIGTILSFLSFLH